MLLQYCPNAPQPCFGLLHNRARPRGFLAHVDMHFLWNSWAQVRMRVSVSAVITPQQIPQVVSARSTTVVVAETVAVAVALVVAVAVALGLGLILLSALLLVLVLLVLLVVLPWMAVAVAVVVLLVLLVLLPWMAVAVAAAVAVVVLLVLLVLLPWMAFGCACSRRSCFTSWRRAFSAARNSARCPCVRYMCRFSLPMGRLQ